VEICPGAPAELLAIRAGSVREAVATAHPDRVVIHAGRVVARTVTIRHRASNDVGLTTVRTDDSGTDRAGLTTSGDWGGDRHE
jgi:cytosine deaminase